MSKHLRHTKYIDRLLYKMSLSIRTPGTLFSSRIQENMYAMGESRDLEINLLGRLGHGAWPRNPQALIVPSLLTSLLSRRDVSQCSLYFSDLCSDPPAARKPLLQLFWVLAHSRSRGCVSFFLSSITALGNKRGRALVFEVSATSSVAVFSCLALCYACLTSCSESRKVIVSSP